VRGARPLTGRVSRSAAAVPAAGVVVAGVPAVVAVADGVAFLGFRLVDGVVFLGWGLADGTVVRMLFAPEGTARLADAEGVGDAAIPPRPDACASGAAGEDAPAARARTMPAAATSAAPVRFLTRSRTMRPRASPARPTKATSSPMSTMVLVTTKPPGRQER
jgi:hypothetical protein